jgi:TrmH family RNA methyltransferase
METITTRRHALVARFRDVARGDEDDVWLLDGAHLVRDAIGAGLRLRQVIVSSEGLDRPEIRAILQALPGRDVEIASATSMVMDAVSPVRSASGIVALADRSAMPAERMYAGAAPLVIVATDVQDPGNLGAMVRVAEAGGATGVIAAGTSASPFGWKALRGSMGSALRLPIAIRRETAAAIDDARRQGCRIVATVPHGGDAHVDADLSGSVALLVGGEGSGLSPALLAQADALVSVPMQAPVESLNAAVAAAILVYEARRQRTGRPAK